VTERLNEYWSKRLVEYPRSGTSYRISGKLFEQRGRSMKGTLA
jgi:hypothetical protein